MVNYLAKFSRETADLLTPINAITGKASEWVWEQAQQDAFEKVKTMLSQAPVLIPFDVAKPHRVSADASFGASVISSLTSTSYAVKSKGTPEKMTRTPLSKRERITLSQNSPPCGNLCLLSLVCLNDQQRFPCHRP